MTHARQAAALAAMKAATIALAPEAGLLLTRAARAAGMSRAELVRRRLRIVFDRYRPKAKPGSAGVGKRRTGV